MTTATARIRSARSGMGRCVAVQNGEHRLQFSLQVPDRLGAEGPAGFGLQVPGATVGFDLLARALDGVLLRVEQVFDEHDELDLAPLVHAVAGPVLGGIEEPELALPIPQDVGLEVGQLTDLADGEELLHGVRYAHRHCSGLGSRSIKSARSEEHTSELQSHVNL